MLRHPVNLAAYLKNKARSGEVLIDEQTFQKIDKLQKYFSLDTCLNENKINTISYYPYSQ